MGEPCPSQTWLWPRDLQGVEEPSWGWNSGLDSQKLAPQPQGRGEQLSSCLLLTTRLDQPDQARGAVPCGLGTEQRLLPLFAPPPPGMCPGAPMFQEAHVSRVQTQACPDHGPWAGPLPPHLKSRVLPLTSQAVLTKGSSLLW